MADVPQKKYFDTEKQKKALEWLRLKWSQTNQGCEICQAKSWSIAEDLIMPMTFTGGGLVVGGPTYPQMMVICTNCGNTKYFNAVTVGLVEAEAKKEGEHDAK